MTLTWTTRCATWLHLIVVRPPPALLFLFPFDQTLEFSITNKVYTVVYHGLKEKYILVFW